jgi:hypothetical protein
MDLTDILRVVKEGKMDLKTAEQQALGLGLSSTQALQNLIHIENPDRNHRGYPCRL